MRQIRQKRQKQQWMPERLECDSEESSARGYRLAFDAAEGAAGGDI